MTVGYRRHVGGCLGKLEQPKKPRGPQEQKSAETTARLAGVSAAAVERARRVERDASDLRALIGNQVRSVGYLAGDGAWRLDRRLVGPSERRGRFGRFGRFAGEFIRGMGRVP